MRHITEEERLSKFKRVWELVHTTGLTWGNAMIRVGLNPSSITLFRKRMIEKYPDLFGENDFTNE